MRTILHLNSALAALAPAQGRPVGFVLDHQHVAQVVEAIGRLAVRASEDLHLPKRYPVMPVHPC
jgi:hypothetical protein